MRTFHRIAAENYIATLGLDSDYTVIYTDLGNDGTKIETTYTINQYRDSVPVRYRVRNGLIYTMRWKKGKLSKGKELATYELDGSITLIKKQNHHNMKPYKLPKEFAEKWISALRTTTVKKAIGRMRINDCFCANGIGAISNGFDLREDDNIYIDGKNCEWYPFINIVEKPLFCAVYDLNDSSRLSFPEIADWLELNVELV